MAEGKEKQTSLVAQLKAEGIKLRDIAKVQGRDVAEDMLINKDGKLLPLGEKFIRLQYQVAAEMELALREVLRTYMAVLPPQLSGSVWHTSTGYLAQFHQKIMEGMDPTLSMLGQKATGIEVS